MQKAATVNGGAGARVAQRARERRRQPGPAASGSRARARIDYSSNLQLNSSTAATSTTPRRARAPSTATCRARGSSSTRRSAATRNQQFFSRRSRSSPGRCRSLTASVSSRKPRPAAGVLRAAVRGGAAASTSDERRPRRSTAACDASTSRPRCGLPISRWPFLNVNLQRGYRTTWYSESLDRHERAGPGRRALTRRYAEFRADIARAGLQQGLHAEQRLGRPSQARDRADFSVQRITTIDGLRRC